MSSIFGEFIYILSLCGDYTRNHGEFSQIHAVFICFTSLCIVFHSFWCGFICFPRETMYSALFSVITIWLKGALIDFYIKICYNIYIRNDNFLEYIHNKGVSNSDWNKISVSTRNPFHAVIGQTEHHQSTNGQRKNILRIDCYSLCCGRPRPQDCIFDWYHQRQRANPSKL